ncbi:hypothetical protein NPIL_515201 [Nephila pilipes]|uniref:Secreted protein n=1 Tax=Nephila pilipes TaxID=299642 RepID=A0A8X6UR45_NEPPI|nr:hypothetical protein NPIL_515201 [Nephila pilipes]
MSVHSTPVLFSLQTKWGCPLLSLLCLSVALRLKQSRKNETTSLQLLLGYHLQLCGHLIWEKSQISLWSFPFVGFLTRLELENSKPFKFSHLRRLHVLREGASSFTS